MRNAKIPNSRFSGFHGVRRLLPLFALTVLLLSHGLTLSGIGWIYSVDSPSPDDPKTLVESGRKAWEAGRGYEAQAALIAALDHPHALDPKDAASAAEMLDKIYEEGKAIEVMRQKNDIDNEERFLSYRVGSHPKDAVALALRGLARKKQYRLEDALEDLVAAQKLGLSDLALRADVQRSRIELEQFDVINSTRGRDAAEEYRFHDVRDQVLAYDRMNDWRGLETYLGTVMTRENAAPYAAVQRGYLRIALGGLDGAMEDFTFALQSDPSDITRADVERGERLVEELRRRREGTLEDVAASGLLTIASDPALMQKMPSAPWLRAAVKVRLADQLARMEALTPLELVLEQLKDMPMIDSERARFMASVGEAKWAEGKLDEAAGIFHSVLELDVSASRRAGLLYRLARYAELQGNREEAIDYARKSAAAMENQERAQIRIGKFFVELGEYQEGVDHFQKAGELAESPEERCAAYENIMDVYRTTGDQEKFIETAEHFIAAAQEVKPPMPERLEGMAEYYQGEIHQARGDEDRAYAYYERASRRVTSLELRSQLLMRLAETDAQRSYYERAATYAKQSAALFPDRPSKSREVAAFLNRLGMDTAATDYADRVPWLTDVERMLHEYSRRAEAAKRNDNETVYLENAKAFVDTASTTEQDLLPAEQGLAEYYRAELLRAEGGPEQAYAAYENAATMLTDRYRLSDAYRRMAEMDARRNQIELAITLAGQAADLLSDRNVVQQEVGDFLKELGHPDKAQKYLARAIRLPRAAGEGETPASEFDEGIQAFDEAERLAVQGDADGSYESFKRAAALLPDGSRRAETFMKLADYEAQRGRRDLAEANVARSAAILPDQPWKLRQAANFMLRMEMPDKAADYYDKLLTLGPSQSAYCFDTLAQAFKRADNQEEYRKYAARYRDAVLHAGHTPSKGEAGLAAYYSGELLAATGDDDAAARDYEQAAGLLTNRHRLAEAYMKLAEHNHAKGELELAAAQAERAAEVMPDQPGGLLRTAKFLLDQEMPDKAFPYYRRWYAAMPVIDREPGELFTLAEAFQQRGETDKAFDVLRLFMKTEDVASISPEEAEGLLAYYQARTFESRGDMEQALAAYERASGLIKDPPRLSDTYRRMAECRMRTGDREAAAAYAKKSAELQSDDPRTLRETGAFFMRMGDMNEAQSYFDKYIALSPPAEEQASVHAVMAEGYKKAGLVDEYVAAVERYGNALTAGGRSPTPDEEGRLALFQADIYEEQGDPDKAFQAYEYASRVVGNRHQLADIHFRMASYLADNGKTQQAIEHMETSVSYFPNVPWKLRQAGGFYGRIDMQDKMLEYYHRALDNSATAENKAASYAALASVYKNLDEQEQFLRYARLYVELQTEQDGVIDDEERGLRYYYQGEIYMAENKRDEAAVAYERAVGLLSNPTRRSDVLYYLALYHAERGDRDKAVELLEQSLAEQPDVPRRLRQAGGFANMIGLRDKMIEYCRLALDKSTTPSEKALSSAALAGAYKSIDDKGNFLVYARQYVDIQTERDASLDNEEKGLRHYYQAEIHDAENEPDLAYAEYERASQLLTNPTRLSDAYFQMARYQSEKGDKDKANAFLERAMAQQPDDPRRLRAAGGTAGRLGMPEVMLEYYHRALDLSTTPEDRAASLLALTGAYKEQKDADQEGGTAKFLTYARQYVDLQTERDAEINDEARGQRHYYQAEIHLAEGNPDAAYAEYERASQLMTNPTRLSDVFYQMARYHAERKDKDKAADFMEKSVAEQPNQLWKLRQAGAFYGDLGDSDKMIEYYRTALDKTTSPDETAKTYLAMAGAYRGLEDKENFIAYARRYVALQTERDSEINDEERGLRFLHQAEIDDAEENPDAAYRAYEQASRLMKNPSRLSDVYYRMAQYHADKEDRARAADFMEQSVAQQPGLPRKLRQAGAFYNRLEMPDRMLEHYRRALDYSVTPEDRASSYAALASAYRGLEDKENFLAYARNYVSLQTLRDAELDDEERGQRETYRAQIYAAEDNPDAAYLAYEHASHLLKNPGRLADVLFQMAEYHVTHEDTTGAEHYIKRLLALQPDELRRHRQAGGLYARLKMTQEAAERYRRSVELAKTPLERAAARLSLADVYKDADNKDQYLYNLKQYLQEMAAAETLTDEQQSARLYYQGEAYLAEGKPEHAVYQYQLALQSVLNDSRRIDLHLKIAEYYAGKNKEKGVAFHVDRALAVVPPEIRTLRRIAGIYNGMGRYDLEDRYFRHALALAPSFHERAPVFAAMAGTAKARRNEARYLSLAREYIGNITEHWQEAADGEKGMSEYYQGEIHAAEKNDSQAYEAYSRAVELLEDKSRLSETYLKLARYDVERRDKAAAANHALLAASAEPDKGYRVSEASRILNSLRRYSDSVAILQRAIDLDPVGTDNNLGNDYLHKYLAETYVEGIDKKEGLAINAAYIDRLVDRMDGGPPVVDEKIMKEWWDARRKQTRWDKNWGGLESRLFGSRNNNGNFSLGTYTELKVNLKFPNGFKATAYAEVGGTLKAHSTGEYYTGKEWRQWESNSYLSDTLYAKVGLGINPLKKLPQLEFRAEYYHGLARNDDRDFRLRLKWDRTEGLYPKLFGNMWKYKKEEADLIYSVTNRDLTSDGTIRRGFVYTPCWDRNLLLAPYGFVDYSYAGKDAADKWGLAVGPGIVMRKFYREDKYHTPQSYIEFNIRYRIGLTRGKQDALSFNLTHSF